MKDKNYILRKIKKFKRDYQKYKYIKGILKGVIFSLFLITIYFLLIITGVLIYKEGILMSIFIAPVILFFVISFFKKKTEREIIKKADERLELEQRLITYYDYQNEENKNPFYSSLENELATLLKKIPGQAIFKLKWQKYIQLTAILLGIIIFLNSYFTINSDSDLNYNSTDDIFQQEENTENYQDIEKIEFINPLESNINNEIGEEISTIENDEINKIDEKKLNNDLEENFEKPDIDKNQEGELAELEKRLEKIEEEKQKKDSEINIDGKKDGEDQEQDSSYLWKNQNKDGLVENEKNIYKPGDKESENGDKGNEGPGAEGSEKAKEEGKEYQAIGENEDSLSDTKNLKGDGSGNSGQGDGDKKGVGAGENEGLISNKDDFSKKLNLEESERLKSQISSNNYLNTYLEEKYRSQNKNEGDNILDSYINHRNFLLDSIRDENIPFAYKEMIKDYFIIIKD